MSKKNNVKSGKKDSQLVIRINKEDRDAFLAICNEIDTSAAREVRRFIKDFLKSHEVTLK